MMTSTPDRASQDERPLLARRRQQMIDYVARRLDIAASEISVSGIGTDALIFRVPAAHIAVATALGECMGFRVEAAV